MTKISVFLLFAIGSWSGASAFSPSNNQGSKSAVRPLSSSVPQNPSKEYELIASNDEWLRQVLGDKDQRQVGKTASGFLPTAAALVLAMTLMASGLGSIEEPSMFASSAVIESPKERVVQQNKQIAEEDVAQMLDQSAGFFFF